jgi:hypothetical protein
MDLASLLQVEDAAERLTLRGVARLAAGESEAARQHLLRVLALRRTPFAELLMGFAGAIEAGRPMQRQPEAMPGSLLSTGIPNSTHRV